MRLDGSGEHNYVLKSMQKNLTINMRFESYNNLLKLKVVKVKK